MQYINHYLDKAGLKLLSLCFLPLPCQVLGLKACATMVLCVLRFLTQTYIMLVKTELPWVIQSSKLQNKTNNKKQILASRDTELNIWTWLRSEGGLGFRSWRCGSVAEHEHLTRMCKALGLIPTPQEVKKGRRQGKGGEERKERAKEGRQLSLGLLDFT